MSEHGIFIKRRKKCLIAVMFLSILIILLMILPKIWSSDESRYSRKVEENLFSLGMEPLNCTIAEPFSLQKGDTIDVGVVSISGELSVFIGQENREPVYEGKKPAPGSFQVTIPEDGEYLISVSGKRAEGSISFRIDRAADDR